MPSSEAEGGRIPPCRASFGPSHTQRVHVPQPERCRLRQAATRRGKEAGPLPTGPRPAQAAHHSSCAAARMLLAVPSSEGGEGHPPPARYLPVPVVHGLERPLRSRQRRRRGSRATSRRASPGSGRALPVHVSRPGCCWLCQAARGREEGPFQPGLAGLGPRNACACVAAGTLTDVSSNEKGWQGPSYRDSPGSGRAPPCACVAAMTLSAVPSSEGEEAVPLPAGPRPAQVAHRPCVSRP